MPGKEFRDVVCSLAERNGLAMAETGQIRIFSVDDHPLLHEGLATVIRHQPDMALVAEAFNGRDAVQLFREHTPDVTLMDLRLPDMSGLDATVSIRREFPEARVIILTTFAGDAEIQLAMDAGARGYMLKSLPPRELMEVIRQVHAGKRVFSQSLGHVPHTSQTLNPAKQSAEAADTKQAPNKAKEPLAQSSSERGFRRFADWFRRL